MIKDLFIELTKSTYPSVSWNKDSKELLSKIPVKLNRDIWGNYWYKIGNSCNMFTSHLDTVGDKSRVNHKIKNMMDKELICTDGNSVLGADDKAGVVILIKMIEANIPGLYYFFLGEEDGAKGSKSLAKDFYNVKHTEGITKVISFDRKGYTSIITHQMNIRCCSDIYADKLIRQFSKHGLDMKKDPTGSLSDSMSFYNIPEITEITNISVGYFNEHTNDEYQDITFLEKLVNIVLRVDWDNNSYLIREFSTFISSIR